MTTLALTTGDETLQHAEWLHWLFVREGRAISCGVDVRGDGFYTVTLLPLWGGDENLTEVFETAGDALRRHGQIARFLQASGWLLADRGIVTSAA
jgi:hypothetical protein